MIRSYKVMDRVCAALFCYQNLNEHTALLQMVYKLHVPF